MYPVAQDSFVESIHLAGKPSPVQSVADTHIQVPLIPDNVYAALRRSKFKENIESCIFLINQFSDMSKNSMILR
jgi:hypothetical protein